MQLEIGFTNEDGVFSGENCGQAAIATVLAYYKLISATKEAFLDLESKYKPKYCGTDKNEIRAICRKYGLPIREMVGKNNLRKNIRAGHPVILAISPGFWHFFSIKFPSDSHWVVAYDFDDQYIHLTNTPLDGKMLWRDFMYSWACWPNRLMGVACKGFVKL